MAGVLFTNILEALGLESGNTEEEQRVDELYEELEDQDYDRQWSHRKRHKVVKTNDGKELSMLLVKPKTHADAQIIIDSLKIRRPVIVNLENNEVVFKEEREEVSRTDLIDWD